MEIKFGKEYLYELYTIGKSKNKKYRFQPNIVSKYTKLISVMITLPNTEALFQYKSLHYEKLKGDKIGISSIRINDQYRIEFEEYIVNGQSYATVCNITELSNHYK